MMSRLHSLFDQSAGGMQADKAHFVLRKAAGKHLSILLRQCRARQNGVLACLSVLEHALMQNLEPRPSVGVGESYSSGHFLPAFRRVIIVGVFELPSDASGQQGADGRFAGAAYAHQDQDHGLRPSNLPLYAHSPSPGFGIKKTSSPSTRL